MKNINNNFISDLSGKNFPLKEKMHGNEIRQSLLEFIQQDNPAFTEESLISSSELNQFRQRYISKMLSKEISQLNDLESRVMQSVNDQTILSDKIDTEDFDKISFGQKVADKVASFGGSWTFIISFGIFILIWININALWFSNQDAYDPYPFILLNLILSCIAALQAPIIMMSQNRQEEKDRGRARKDYMINLKSELEIRILHEKIDHLMMHQQQELMEIQRVQIEMMEDIMKNIKH